jgi:hypothetical protein
MGLIRSERDFTPIHPDTKGEMILMIYGLLFRYFSPDNIVFFTSLLFLMRILRLPIGIHGFPPDKPSLDVSVF